MTEPEGTPLPDFEGFRARYDAGRSQVVRRWIDSDLETPVSAYLKLSSQNARQGCFLLESVEGGAVLGRYSAIGLAPDFVWSLEKGCAMANGVPEAQPALDSLRRHVAQSRIDFMDEDVPPIGPFGLFGYLGYGMVRLIESVPDSHPDCEGIPDGILIRPTLMAVFDNVRHRICIMTPVRPGEGQDARAAWESARTRIESVIGALAQPVDPARLNASTRLEAPLAPLSNLDRAQYHDIVRKAVAYIEAGEIFQIVPSRRFSVPFDLPPFELYRSLRRLNPSPFLFFLDFGNFSLVGSSPEVLVRVRNGTITIRPIAGTRPRGKTPDEDRTLAAELLADAKERAEHLMLLDLGRNDVGRVAETGSVKVTESFFIERYSHVMHIVSNVEGRLRQGLDALDALLAGFPAGTVSGAPKVRAMEIIDALETARRSFYAGCVGYISGSGDLDTCIALRTALVKDGTLVVQAGGGVVADSDPECEYQETENKARAVIRAAEDAVQRAHTSLDAAPLPPVRKAAR